MSASSHASALASSARFAATSSFRTTAKCDACGESGHYERDCPNKTSHPQLFRGSGAASGHSVRPFSSPPFTNFAVNPLGVAPKKNGGHRVIMYLSFSQGSSVNDVIAKDEHSLTYCKVDDIVRLITSVGTGSLMTKVDIRDPLCLIPVRKEDWSLLKFKRREHYYFD